MKNQIFALFLGMIVLLTFTTPDAFGMINQDDVSLKMSAGDNTVPVSSFSFNHVVGNGQDRILLVGISHRQCVADQQGNPARDVTDVQVDGQSITKLIGPNIVRGACADLWYKLNPTVGINTIDVTLDGNVNSFVSGAVSYFGVDQTNPFGIPVSTSGLVTTQPSLIVSADTGDLVVDVLAVRNEPTSTVASVGQLELWNAIDDDLITGAASSKPAASDVTMSWSITGLGSNDVWAQIGVALKPSVSSIIGGEILPIESTALILAGLQTSAIWLAPVVISAIGIGLVLVRRK